MMKSLQNLLVGSALLAVMGSSTALATTFQFEIDNPPTSSSNDYIDSITTTYNDTTGVLTWESTFSADNGRLPNLFWLVINGGPEPSMAPNPKGNEGDYAILYGDMTNGILSAYVYDGRNSQNSYQDADAFLQGGLDLIVNNNTDGTRTASFSLDTNPNAENNFGNLAEGIGFGEYVGIWFHASVGGAQYDDEGLLMSFSGSRQGWYDTAYRETTQIPVPPSMALMGLGLLALRLRRQR